MHPIIDTAMLKHHRVDYGKRIDTKGARRPANTKRSIVVVISALIAAHLISTTLA